MRILLDTQVVYFAANGENRVFSKQTEALIADPDNDRLLSTASILEIGIKSSKGTVGMTKKQMYQAIEDLQITILPFTAHHANRFFDLPLHHKDPFDRMLIATALAEDVAIVTSDRAFPQYRGLRIIH